MSTTSPVSTPTLSLSPALTEAIRQHAFEGLKALPKRGAEIGGLIAAENSAPLEATHLRLVATEHLFGPSYCLSENDLPALREAVRECQDKGLAVAAYFRSCTRANLQVEAEDLHAIAYACPGIGFIVIAQPSLNRSARIHLFARDADDSWTGVNVSDVVPRKTVAFPTPEEPDATPVDRLPPSAPSTPERAPSPALGTVPGDRYRIEDPNPVPAAANEFRNAPRLSGILHLWKWPAETAGAILFGALMFAAFTLWPKFHASTTSHPITPVSPPPSTAPGAAPRDGAALGLTVREENGMLHVMWDRNSPAARSGNPGALDIIDGRTSRTIEIGAEDIARGSIFYPPTSPDVTFRLRIFGDGGRSTEEMLRMVGNDVFRRKVEEGRPAASPARPTAPKRSDPPAASPRASFSQPSETHASPAASPARTDNPLPPSRPDTASGPRVEPLRSGIGQPGAVSSNTAAKGPETNQPSPSAQSALSARPVDIKPANTGPRADSPVAVADVHRATPASAPSVLTPLEAIRKVMPTKPLALKIYAPTTIAVIVSVDEKGKVTKAVPEPGGSHQNAFLLGLSLEAARNWVFRPAALNGSPIRAEQRIEFVFRPQDESR